MGCCAFGRPAVAAFPGLKRCALALGWLCFYDGRRRSSEGFQHSRVSRQLREETLQAFAGGVHKEARKHRATGGSRDPTRRFERSPSGQTGRRTHLTRSPRILLIGPYDPLCGEYTFLAPPLGVWRLAGVLESAGVEVKVFDPNCCAGPAPRALERGMLGSAWDIIGVSTTGMTLRFDLELAHLARRLAPQALLLAGGMEATFRPELMFSLGPFDCV